MNYDSNGYLQINAATAGGILPIPNLNLRIIGADEENNGIIYSVFTNSSGKTEVITLPAPARDFSLSPNSGEQVYSKYIVEAYGEGFYPKKIYDVAVFSGIKSILALEMIPDGGLVKNISAPNGNNVTIIDENEDL
jgi:hypothetical protein